MTNTAQALYKVHFQDQLGSGTIICYTHQEYNELIAVLRDDPAAEDIWTEYWDEEEGWQA